MQNEKQIADIKAAFASAYVIIEKFDNETFNQVPFETSWTAAQVTEHICLVAGGFLELVNGEVKDTERPIDRAVADLEINFTNYDIQMQAPAMALPEMKDYTIEELLAKLKKIEAGFLNALPILELAKLCTSFEIPNSGYFTRLEAVTFAYYHTTRHTKQLEQIELLVNFKADVAVVSTKVLDFRREKIFDAYTQPSLLAKWWGPKGFITTIQTHELKVGGKWNLTMSDTEGKNYPIACEFIKIYEPILVSWFHFDSPHYQSIVTLAALADNQTEITFKMVFKEVATANQMRDFMQVKNEEGFEKLAKLLANESEILS